MVIRNNGDSAFSGTVVTFHGSSAALDEGAEERLRELVPLLVGKANRIEVRGHTARHPFSDGHDEDAEWQFSFARSMAVLKFLEEEGIEPQRMRLSQACSFEPPVRQKDGHQEPEAHVEVYLLSEFVDGPAHEDHRHSPISTILEQGDPVAHTSDAEPHESEVPPLPLPKPTANHTVKKPAPPPKTPAKSSHGGGHGSSSHGGGHGKPATKKPDKPAQSGHGGH